MSENPFNDDSVRCTCFKTNVGEYYLDGDNLKILLNFPLLYFSQILKKGHLIKIIHSSTEIRKMLFISQHCAFIMLVGVQLHSHSQCMATG